MASAAPYAIMGLQLVGGVMAGASAAAQGNAQLSAAYENARIQDENARRLADAAALEEQQGVTAASRTRRQGRIYRGQTLSGYAAAGVDVSSGSPLEALSELAKETEFQALQAKFEHDQKAWQMRVGAYDLAQQAVQTRRFGLQAQQTGYAQASSALFSGLTRAAGTGFDLLAPASGGGTKYGDVGELIAAKGIA